MNRLRAWIEAHGYCVPVVLLTLSILFFECTSGFAQSGASDSLRSVWLNPDLPDTARLKAHFLLIQDEYLFSKPDSAFLLLEEQFDFAKKANVPKRMSQARSMQGITWAVRGNPDKAIEYFSTSLDLTRKSDNLDGQAADLGNLANIYQMKGDFANAIDYLKQSLAIYESLKDEEGITNCYLLLGHFNRSQKELEIAKTYYTEALKGGEKIGDKNSQAIALSSLASITETQGDDALALSLVQKSLELKEAVNNRILIASSLKDIGNLYLKAGRMEEARSYLNRALDYAFEDQNLEIQSSGLTRLSQLELKENHIASAVKFGEQAYDIAHAAGIIAEETMAAEVLYQAYKSNRQPAEALAMHEVFVTLTDSTKNEENRKGVLQQRFQYEYEKKEALARAEQEKKNVRQALIRNSTLAGLGGSLLFLLIVSRQRNRISREKERSEELLLNILPAEVAEELKAKGEAEAKHFEEATILFTDFKDFTQLSNTMSPTELVAELNECFRAFDEIIVRHRIEKIKTIGDAYMAAGGLPDPHIGKPVDVVRAALDMQAYLVRHKAEREAVGSAFFEMRVGIHTGPVVAGIVGVKKFQYDIWGDTVNIAARMESSGEVGRVNISQSTYDLVKDQYTCTPRGKIEAKNIGEVHMYFVDPV